MKRFTPALLILTLALTACTSQATSASSYDQNLVEPADTTSSSQLPTSVEESEASTSSPELSTPTVESQTPTSSSEYDPFQEFGVRETDYSLDPKQVVHIGDTVEGLNLMDFSSTSTTADFVSQAKVTVDAVQRISSTDPLAAQINANEYYKNTGLDWLLLTITIQNTGSAKADFVTGGGVWSVPEDTMVLQQDEAHFWAGNPAYLSGDITLSLLDDYFALAPGETVTVTLARTVSPDAPAENETLYWELNPHADSFFYDTGRDQVWFVELAL